MAIEMMTVEKDEDTNAWELSSKRAEGVGFTLSWEQIETLLADSPENHLIEKDEMIRRVTVRPDGIKIQLERQAGPVARQRW